MLTPAILLHLSGPLPQPRNLLFRYVTEQIRHRRVLGPSCICGGKRAQTADHPRIRTLPTRQRLAKTENKRAQLLSSLLPSSGCGPSRACFSKPGPTAEHLLKGTKDDRYVTLADARRSVVHFFPPRLSHSAQWEAHVSRNPSSRTPKAGSPRSTETM